MALAPIGTATLDFDNPLPVLFPSVELKSDSGYLFFIRTIPDSVVTKQQYVNLIATYETTTTTVEFPLEAKFFPKGYMMAFSVAVPKLSFWDDPEVQILALPKEFYPGTGTIRQLDVELLWEDKEDYEANSVSF